MSEYEKQCASGKSTSRSYKVTFVGPEGAGKISSVQTLLNKPFDPKEPSTVGASLNFQAIVSFILKLLQQPEAHQGFELDESIAIGWKQATVEDLQELLDKEYSTEMYNRLEKLVEPVVAQSTSPQPDQEHMTTEAEDEDEDGDYKGEHEHDTDTCTTSVHSINSDITESEQTVPTISASAHSTEFQEKNFSEH